MKRASVAGWTGIMAILFSGAVVTLMLYRATADTGGGAVVSLNPTGWAILVSAFGCLAISIALTVYAHFLRATAISMMSDIDQRVESAPPDIPDGLTDADTEFDTSRLPEDERRLYQLIEDSGGEILQMKLVSIGEFSKSKVTRLLDRLEERDLVRRERHGMTNLVRVTKKH